MAGKQSQHDEDARADRAAAVAALPHAVRHGRVVSGRRAAHGDLHRPYCTLWRAPGGGPARRGRGAPVRTHRPLLVRPRDRCRGASATTLPPAATRHNDRGAIPRRPAGMLFSAWRRTAAIAAGCRRRGGGESTGETRWNRRCPGRPVGQQWTQIRLGPPHLQCGCAREDVSGRQAECAVLLILSHDDNNNCARTTAWANGVLAVQRQPIAGWGAQIVQHL